MSIENAKGALIGQAVGDALGTTLEFSQPGRIEFPVLVAGPHREITGGGPFRVALGQVTDDTQMAVCLASSLASLGHFEPEDVAQRYVQWRKVAFDVGGQTSGAISAYVNGAPAERAGYLSWDRGGRRAAGNGSLMRTSPIGVFFALRPADLQRASLLDSAITHADPRCMLACASFNAAIGFAVREDKPDPEEMADAAARDLHVAALALRDDEPFKGMFSEEEIDKAVGELCLDLASAEEDDPCLYEPGLSITGTQGFVRVAFTLAFWHLLHAEDFESALVDVVNRGGDADTNGAIAGALLGAYFGRGGIPERWQEAVLQSAPRPPWDDTYHPRRLLALVPLAPKEDR